MTPKLQKALEASLPAMVRAKALTLTSGDVLVHAPGFEDRTLSITRGLTVDGSAAGILLRYEPSNAQNRLEKVRSLLTALGLAITDDGVLTYDRFLPGDFESRLRLRFQLLSAKRVVVDISTMSKLAILLVLNACIGLELEVDIVYCEAQQYGPSQEEFETAKSNDKIHQPSLHVFNGIHGVVRADSLASVAMQGQPTAAIVFMSFNDALTQLLLNTVYPGRLFLINGKPPIHSWREGAMAWVHEQVRREWSEDNPLEGNGSTLPGRAASTLDYRESIFILLDLYWRLSANHRILLAPSGSKMQTVACFLAKALHPDIHIEYPSPEGFAREYSTGIGDRWLLSLGRLERRLADIDEAERKNFLEIAL
jgi:hypothetical protein